MNVLLKMHGYLLKMRKFTAPYSHTHTHKHTDRLKEKFVVWEKTKEIVDVRIQ